MGTLFTQFVFTLESYFFKHFNEKQNCNLLFPIFTPMCIFSYMLHRMFWSIMIILGINYVCVHTPLVIKQNYNIYILKTKQLITDYG